jgi:hypothetical protein
MEPIAIPVHDWTRVDAGLFHNFRLGWVVRLDGDLNAGGLPSDYFAMIERPITGTIAKPLDMQLSPGDVPEPANGTVPIAVSDAPPCVHIIPTTAEERVYARMAARITVRHGSGRVVAVIEIVSPGNKGSSAACRSFVQRTADLIEQGIHVLVIDLFPPGKRDPQGIHKAIWDELEDERGGSALPPDKRLTLASYDAGLIKTAYVEPVAVGDVLPDMPLFLEPGYYVNVPLEATYRTTWDVFPRVLKGRLDPARETDDQLV